MAKPNLPPLGRRINNSKPVSSVSKNPYLTAGDTSGLDDIKYFSGFYENIYRDSFIGGNAFIFITRPQLFLTNDIKIANQNSKEFADLALENMTIDPKFTPFMINERPNELDKQLFNSLSYFGNFSSNFLPMFTNQCKNFETINKQLETIDAFETKQGFKEVLPTFTTGSEASNQVAFSVNEDANLSFTKLMSLWVNYISNVVDGTFNANPVMITNGIIDYMSSIYYFVLAPDGQTIKYWCRYTGCWPTTIPYGSFRYAKGSTETIDLDINFVYTVKEDMDPGILEDFNILSLNISPNERANISDPKLIGNFSYGSLDTSPLLSLQSTPGSSANSMLANKLREYAKNPDERRDPVIVYNKNSSKAESKSFQLVFDKYAYTSNFLTSEFKDVLSTENNEYEHNVFYSNYGPEGSSEYNSWAEEIII